MSVRILGARAAAPLALAALITTACTPSGVDGKYYNAQTGEFAMELKGGKVLSMQGMDSGASLTYDVKGDSVIIHAAPGSMVDHLALHIEKNGDLNAGILGSLTKTQKK